MTNLKNVFNTKKFVLFLICCLVAGVGSFGYRDVYAAGLILNGDTEGLRITPENEDLFHIGNMLPGESAVSAIEIQNTDNYAFSLSVEVENLIETREGEPDLLDVLDIIVSMDNEVIASFPAKGGTYPLGVFAPGETAALDVEVIFQNAGNEYQGKIAKLQWIFTAESEYTEPRPTPGPDSDSGEGGGGSTLIAYSGPGLLIPETPDAVPVSSMEVFDGEAPESITELPDEETPQGASELEPKLEPEMVELPEEEVPQGPTEMPKTGEMSLLGYLIPGVAMCGLGAAILFGGRKKKGRINH